MKCAKFNPNIVLTWVLNNINCYNGATNQYQNELRRYLSCVCYHGIYFLFSFFEFFFHHPSIAFQWVFLYAYVFQSQYHLMFRMISWRFLGYDVVWLCLIFDIIFYTFKIGKSAHKFDDNNNNNYGWELSCYNHPKYINCMRCLNESFLLTVFFSLYMFFFSSIVAFVSFW